MGGTAAAIGVVSTVVSAGGAVYKHYQEKSDINKEKDRLKEQGRREAEIHKDRTRKLLGAQRAAYGASGVRVGSGTPLEMIDLTAKEAEAERKDIQKGYGYRQDVLDTASRRAGLTGGIEAGGTLLSGAGEYAKSPYAKNPFATL